MQALTISLLLAPLALAASVDLSSRQSACSATHIFIAKGNNEPYPGRQGVLVNAICSGLENCDYEDILFYNPVEAPYCGSVNQGVEDGIAQITAYNARCPDTKLVVSGYSQGAQIVGDILGGGGGVFFQGCIQNDNAGIDVNSAAGKKIAAALVFGNTRHTAGQSYNQLTGGNGNGLFPRTGAQLAGLATWSSKFHDYCVASDPVCAGGDTVANHLNYFDIYTDSAAAWVKSMLTAASASPSSIVSSTAINTITSTTGSYPTATPYGNSTTTGGTTKITSIPAIPTITLTGTHIVTVPCASVNTAALTGYTTFPPYTGAYTTSPSTVGGAATTTARASPTSSGVTNGTVVPFTGAASTSTSSFSMFGLVCAGLMMMAL